MKKFCLFSLFSVFFLLFDLSATDLFSPLEYDISSFVAKCPNGYAISRSKGFCALDPLKKKWVQKNAGLPKKVVYPFEMNKIRELTAFGVSPYDFYLVVVSDNKYFFMSKDGGDKWISLKNMGLLKSSLYFTAVIPINEKFIIAGTSDKGIFFGRINNLSISWSLASHKADPTFLVEKAFQQIDAFTYLKGEQPRLYVALAFNSGLYEINLPKDFEIEGKVLPVSDWKKIELPTEEAIEFLHHNKKKLFLYTHNKVYRYNLKKESWSSFMIKLKRKHPPNFESHRKRVDLSANKKGLYIRSDKAANSQSYKKLLDLIEQQGFNSFVVDMKNDGGFLTYKTEIPFVKKVGAYYREGTSQIDVKTMLKEAHARNIYVIGRVVVFKDRKLYQYKKNRYAAWDKYKDKPWGNFIKRYNKKGEPYFVQTEYWVDPFCSSVWDYNRQITLELESLGFDEIQFDYIRFPSDGATENIRWRYRRLGMRRIDALESFLKFIREKVEIPISVDLYGYQSYFQMGNWIGQNINMISFYVDAISPMYYPSHFPAYFLDDDDYALRGYSIYKNGSDRAYFLTNQNCNIRPYVQSFLLGDERKMSRNESFRYLKMQLKGVEESQASGFTLWDASNRYWMVQ